MSSFAKLLRKHQGWLKSNGVPSRYFSREREVEDFRVLRTEHFRAMERAGLIRFTDGSATHFHYTLFGAAKTVTWSYFVGIARALSFGRFPRSV